MKHYLNPHYIATVLEGDPVNARQIKEYIKPARLLELLELPQQADCLCADKLAPGEYLPTPLEQVIETYTLRQILGAWVRRMFGRKSPQ